MVVGQRHSNSGERDGVHEKKKVEGMDGVEERSKRKA